MVAQVGGEEGVHTGGAYGVEEAVTGAAAHRDTAHEGVRVAGQPDALRGGGEPGGGAGGEVAEGLGAVELADPAEAATAGGVGRVGYEGPGDPQVQGAGQGVGDAGVGGVGVGVRDVQGDAVPDQLVHDPALEGGGGDRRRTPQVERVVGDDQLGTEGAGLFGDPAHRVDGEEDPVDLRVGVAADGADRVPAFGPLGGPEGVELGDDFRQTGHGGKATCPRYPVVPGGEHQGGTTGSPASSTLSGRPPGGGAARARPHAPPGEADARTGTERYGPLPHEAGAGAVTGVRRRTPHSTGPARRTAAEPGAESCRRRPGAEPVTSPGRRGGRHFTRSARRSSRTRFAEVTPRPRYQVSSETSLARPALTASRFFHSGLDRAVSRLVAFGSP